MRRLLFLLVSLALVGLTAAMMYFSGLLFDASRRIEIEPYIFQPSDIIGDRIGRPVPLAALEQRDGHYVLERLIARFVQEYWGVIPSAADLERRAGPRSPLAAMTLGARTPVHAYWAAHVRPALAPIAEARRLRRVNVHRGLRTQGEYYVVRFDLITYNPNDLDAAPEILSDREMLIRLRYDTGLRTELGGQPFDARWHLESGGEPLVIFKFVVDEVR